MENLSGNGWPSSRVKMAGPALREVLSDKEGFIRSAAAVAIKRVDPRDHDGQDK
jgi:hypothetical protein